MQIKMETSVKSVVFRKLDMTEAKKLYLMQDHRLESFTTSWPFKASESCNIQSMAEAGFYFCGDARENDTAACFVCGKILDGWESTDVPMEEHRKHAPQCLFVKMGKLEKEFSIEDFLTIFRAIVDDKISKKTSKNKTKVRTDCKNYRDTFFKNN